MKKKIISGLLSIAMLMTCFVPIPAAAADSSMPSSYGEKRDVRDQETWGTCWAFGCIAALEEKIKAEEGIDIDLSEEHLLQRTSYGDSSTEWNLTSKDNGGDTSTAIGYFLAGYGPALESEFPYDTENDFTGTVSDAVKNYVSDYRVTETREIIPDQNSDGTLTDSTIKNVKQAVMDNGGVMSTIYMNGDGTEFDTVPGAYYRNEEGYDHGVCIVGWDDNYSAENFASADVTENGAFLARNSWGSSETNDGYLWISYDSVDIAPVFSIESYEKVASNENYYSLESRGTGNVTSSDVPENGLFGYINVFDIQNEAETLEEVIFYVPDSPTDFDLTYKIYYMPLASNGEPNTSAKQLIGSGTVSAGGYYCVKATKDITVTSDAAIMVATCDADDTAYMGQEKTNSEYTAVHKSGQSYKYQEVSGASALLESDYNFTIKLKTKTVDLSTVEKVNASKFTISSISDKTYTGSAIKPSVTVKYNGNVLTKGTDYTVSYSNNVNAGTAKVTIKGTGLYTGSVTKTFTINKAAASKFTVSNISNKAYTGSRIKPAVTVKFNGVKLTAGTDYTIAYSNNKYCGKATYTITGKGNFKGTKTGSFYIKPKQSTITSLTKASKAFTVKMKNTSKTVTGYQVAYSLKKNSGYKYKLTTNTKLKVSGLKSNKYYYVKVRAYKKVGSTKVYGSWSTIKKVKTR